MASPGTDFVPPGHATPGGGGKEELLRLDRAVAAVASRIQEPPEVLVVAGSGLSGLAAAVQEPVRISFQEIPGFPPTGVAGHRGELVSGRMGGRRVLVQAGRFHVYEGHSPATVTLPVRLAASLGARVVILTNAAGGLDRRLPPGTLLLLDDLVNFQFRSALAGAVLPGEERFPDMSAPFDAGLQQLALQTAVDEGILLPRGSYVAVTGPSYETASEIRMFVRLGFHAVGMSTVLEATVARARGMRVLGFSLITNPGAGLSAESLDHGEVLEWGRRGGASLETLVRGILQRMGGD